MTSRSPTERERLVTAIRDLAAEGYSQQQIGEKLGLGRMSVSGLAKRAIPPIHFASRRTPKPPKPIRESRVERKIAAHHFGRSCCWVGCKDLPAGFGKPYCEKHAREARGFPL